MRNHLLLIQTIKKVKVQNGKVKVQNGNKQCLIAPYVTIYGVQKQRPKSKYAARLNKKLKVSLLPTWVKQFNSLVKNNHL